VSPCLCCTGLLYPVWPTRGQHESSARGDTWQRVRKHNDTRVPPTGTLAHSPAGSNHRPRRSPFFLFFSLLRFRKKTKKGNSQASTQTCHLTPGEWVAVGCGRSLKVDLDTDVCRAVMRRSPVSVGSRRGDVGWGRDGTGRDGAAGSEAALAVTHSSTPTAPPTGRAENITRTHTRQTPRSLAFFTFANSECVCLHLVGFFFLRREGCGVRGRGSRTQCA